MKLHMMNLALICYQALLAQALFSNFIFFLMLFKGCDGLADPTHPSVVFFFSVVQALQNLKRPADTSKSNMMQDNMS